MGFPPVQPKNPERKNAQPDKPGARLQRAGGAALARLIRLVARTSTIKTEPATLKADLAAAHPVIVATWHGQFMLTCLLKPDDVRVAAMVARHGDAEVIGEAMAAFGVDLIRGAGAGVRRKDRGGAHALRAALTALSGRDTGTPASLVMTADVPPGPARRAGEGIITIARLSGRPIIAVAAATSRYKAFKTWSRVTINLPFSTAAFVAAPPIYVPRECDAAALEAARCALESALNAATALAYALAGADPSSATPPNASTAPAPPGWLLASYRAAMTMLQPAAGRILAHRLARGKEDPLRLDERQGKASRARPLGVVVWFHSASVGETNAVLPLIHALSIARPDAAIVLTTTTVTSAHLAAGRLPANGVHQFAPLDTPGFADRFLAHWRPDVAIFTESEIWPSLILATAARKTPLLLVNATMSPRSYKRWRTLSSLAEPLFSRFDAIFAQNEKVARWFRDCGARSVTVVGNLKADAPPLPVAAVLLARFHSELGDRPCFLAASTHPGEEAIIAEAHALIARAIPGVCTVIAPRHPARAPEIAAALTAQGLRVARRSLGEALSPQTDIYLADTIGELGIFFTAAPVAFMGKSLDGGGGHNPLEAVAFGTALLAGPSTFNQKVEYAALLKAGGVVEVADAAAIAQAFIHLMGDPMARQAQVDAATAAADRLKGALTATLARVLAALPARSPRAAAELELTKPSGLARAS